MKRKLLCLFLLAGGAMFAQNVNIPDPDLKITLVNNQVLNTNGDTEISYAEAQAYTGGIYAPNLNISDLTGLEAFPNITSVFLPNNNISVANFTANQALEEITIGLNPLTTLDVTGLTNLNELIASSNTIGLSSIDLTTNVSLEVLNLSGNQLSSLDVTNLTNLTNFSASNNQLTSLNLSNNPSLSLMNLYSNNLTSLDLTNQTNITYLSVMQNNLTASALTLPNTTTLVELILSDNPLGSIDVSNFTNLEELRLKNANISTIDLSNNTALEILEAQENNFTTIDLSAQTGLRDLNLNDNSLSTIDLSNNTLLYRIRLENNGLTSLDLTNNQGLQSVYLNNNLYSSLDFSAASTISLISVEDNPNLQIINLANGNNAYLFDFIANNCPNLSCVQLDNGFTFPATTPGFYWEIDPDKDPDLIFGNTTCSLGVESSSLEQLSIYPNPASDLLHIDAHFQIEKITIYNTLGKLVLAQSANTSIEISHLPNGIYFIEIFAEGTRTIKRFIKN